MLDALSKIAQTAGNITAIAACVVLIVKPLREKVLGLSAIKEGVKCLLRAEMLRVYYGHKNEKKIRQYVYENFELAYRAYKALGGNSFIDKIYSEVQTWEVLS